MRCRNGSVGRVVLHRREEKVPVGDVVRKIDAHVQAGVDLGGSARVDAEERADLDESLDTKPRKPDREQGLFRSKRPL